MDGGGFLVQHVDMHSPGEHTRGVEYIGYDDARGELRSHFFGADGELLEYTYRVEGDVLRIWFGNGFPGPLRGAVQPERQDQLRSVAVARRRLGIHDDPRSLSHRRRCPAERPC
jgi:hypothetical protein